MRRYARFFPYAVWTSKSLHLALRILLPAAAGCWLALRSGTTAASHAGTAASTTSSPTFAGSRIIVKPERYPTVWNWLSDMGNWGRVEDLVAVLKQLPPGQDRKLALCLIAYQWQLRDHQGVMNWLDQLPKPEDRDMAFSQIINVWAENDPFAASRWLATQPDSPAKAGGAATLARSIETFDPGAALEWAIVGCEGFKGVETLEWQARWMGRWDVDGSLRILAKSTLPDSQKNRLMSLAVAEWNIAKAAQGNWDQIRGLGIGTAVIRSKP